MKDADTCRQEWRIKESTVKSADNGSRRSWPRQKKGREGSRPNKAGSRRDNNKNHRRRTSRIMIPREEKERSRKQVRRGRCRV